MESLSVVLVGCGRRGRDVFAPILRKMAPEIRFTAVCNRSEPAARELGTRENVAYYTDLDHMMATEKPDVAVVTVSRTQHLEPVQRLLDAGIHVLVETPIADTLADADAIICAAAGKSVKIEVAENFIRKPRQQLVQTLIAADIFGHINLVYSNFVGHGYHGTALIRSYLGLDVQPVRVIGFFQTFTVANHIWRAGQPPRDTEKWQQGVIEFANGSTGVYNFSSLNSSPLRQDQSKNQMSFYAEKGMGVGHDLMYLEGEADRVNIPVERRTMLNQGQEILDAYVARTTPEVAWVNPLSGYLLSEKELDVALCLWELGNAIRENRPPLYGIHNARMDRALELAMEESWTHNNQPVLL